MATNVNTLGKAVAHETVGVQPQATAARGAASLGDRLLAALAAALERLGEVEMISGDVDSSVFVRPDRDIPPEAFLARR
jgi:hypothetical protein